MSTLYARVCDEILERIQTGALKVGDRLPPEADYAVELGISRSTLRLAFAELEASGVLKRRKRAGTQIISDTAKQRFNMMTSGITELLSLGRDTRLHIEGTRTVVTADIAVLEGLHSETGHWLEVMGSRTMPGEATPFSVNRVYVPARYAGIEALIASTKSSVFQLIEQTFDLAVGRVTQAVSAVTCGRDEAAILGLVEHAPALQIEARLYASTGTLMEVSLAVFDPARFQVRSDVEID
ncbi:MAG: GntR family transcriptional regulator [Pseudomonadota bacterium]